MTARREGIRTEAIEPPAPERGGSLPRRLLDRWTGAIREASETGAYALATAATFLWLEAVELWTFRGAIGGLRGPDVDAVPGWIIDFGLDSAMNSLQAAVWPLYWWERIGPWTIALAVGAWIATRLMARLLPDPVRPGEEPSEPAEMADGGAGSAVATAGAPAPVAAARAARPTAPTVPTGVEG